MVKLEFGPGEKLTFENPLDQLQLGYVQWARLFEYFRKKKQQKSCFVLIYILLLLLFDCFIVVPNHFELVTIIPKCQAFLERIILRCYSVNLEVFASFDLLC